jgi:hypothetical protein
VDFVYKQRAEAGEKWALRNAKLRMSRKLVFASGLLRCFFCDLDAAAEAGREALRRSQDPAPLLAYMEAELLATPLDLLARAALLPSVKASTGRKLFDSYERFLTVLEDQEKRDHLRELSQAGMSDSTVWAEVRDFSGTFQEALVELFFASDERLSELTREYGVF